MGKKKAAMTVLGKRKIYVGSISNAPQKKKKTTVASPQPPSQPLPSSQPPSQLVASSTPLSQNAPTSQLTLFLLWLGYFYTCFVVVSIFFYLFCCC
ncbi:hypothetical protein ACOSQ3_023948 [Xanthoceras sorbifolium]